ncbi:MAG: branched-chain amino acid ABC transporter permease [Anaerolineales bacterium]|jgi:branched-chain amino acid transport system permease protein
MNKQTMTLKNFLIPGIILLVGLIILVMLPSYTGIYTPILLTTIFMYIVLTVSWVMFSGPTGKLSLATAAFFGVGIYIAATLGNDMPLVVVVVIGGLVSSVLALLVGALTLRLKGVYFTIFTFGLLELIKHFLLWFEIKYTGTRGRFVVLVDYKTVYFIMLVILILTLLTAYLIRRSKYGLAMQSIGEQEEAAEHIGINVTWVKVSSFAISAFFIGAAGAAMATRWTYIDPYIAFDMGFSFTPVLMAILGGMGSFSGPIVGATILAYLEELLITKFPYYYMLLFGIILVISVLYLPNGLIGLIQKWRSRGMEGKHGNS